MALSSKNRKFVIEYVQCWNATKAADRAGYAHPRQAGSRLLSNVDIQAEIQRHLEENAMTAGEVLKRLGDHARGDMGDFLDIGDDGSVAIDLSRAKKVGQTALIKKFTKTTRTFKDETTEQVAVELYDAQAALQLIGKHLGLFSDKIDVKLTKELEAALDALERELPQETYDQVLGVLATLKGLQGR